MHKISWFEPNVSEQSRVEKFRMIWIETKMKVESFAMCVNIKIQSVLYEIASFF